MGLDWDSDKLEEVFNQEDGGLGIAADIQTKSRIWMLCGHPARVIL